GVAARARPAVLRADSQPGDRNDAARHRGQESEDAARIGVEPARVQRAARAGARKRRGLQGAGTRRTRGAPGRTARGAAGAASAAAASPKPAASLARFLVAAGAGTDPF